MESLVFIFAIMLGGALSLAPTCLVLSATALFIRNYYSLPYLKITVICLLLAMLTTAIISPELEGGIGSAIFLISLISFSWSVIFIPFIWFAKVYGKNKIAQIHEPSFDRKIINTNRLILLTAFISILGSLTLIDEDLSSVTTFSAGFIYSLVLAVCFEIKGKSRFFLGVVILTVGNVLSYFSNFPLIFLPKFIVNITLLIPSVAGAILTFYVIKKLWRIPLSIIDLKVILSYIAIGALLLPLLLLIFGAIGINLKFSAFALSSVIWWIFFTASLLHINKNANK